MSVPGLLLLRADEPAGGPLPGRVPSDGAVPQREEKSEAAGNACNV